MSRGAAVALAVALLLLVLLVVARANSGEPAAVAAIRHEFGTGELAGCMLAIAYRETGGTYNVRAANWSDHHADGSRGSFGMLQIGALWRRPGESVAAFARRMYDPRANAALAHRIYDRYGIAPWGSC